MAPKYEDKHRHLRCSFCGKHQDEVIKLVAGPSAYICNECIDLCSDLLDKEGIEVFKNAPSEDMTSMKPKEIKAKLDEYLIGQDDAKRALAVAVYNHYKRINANIVNEIEVQKSNILLLGPTGVGKTYLAQTLAKMLNVPFAIADATSLTEAGYVGEDVENILLRLIQAADYDIERAERGIIYIDEIDKITRKSDNPSITRDVSGEGVQQALLKILEGTVASVPPQGGRKHPYQDFIQINTNHILFICGGSFSGLEKIIEHRLNKKLIGFGSEYKSASEKASDEVMSQVTTQDLHKFGLIPELVGRLPVIVTLPSLNEEALLSILTKPKNALARQYKHLFELDDVILEFEEDALRAIAHKAIERETGARGLRAIMEEFMGEIMYDIPSNHAIEKCIITKETVQNKSYPLITYNENRKPLVKKSKSRNHKRFSAS